MLLTNQKYEDEDADDRKVAELVADNAEVRRAMTYPTCVLVKAL